MSVLDPNAKQLHFMRQSGIVLHGQVDRGEVVITLQYAPERDANPAGCNPAWALAIASAKPDHCSVDGTKQPPMLSVGAVGFPLMDSRWADEAAEFLIKAARAVVPFNPGATADRTAIRAGMQHAAGLASELDDSAACDRLIVQLMGVTRAAQRLGATLAAEANAQTD